MLPTDRPSFDPKNAKGAIGASLFDSVSENNPTNPPQSIKSNKKKTRTKKQTKKQSKPVQHSSKPASDRPLTVSEIAEQIGQVLIDHLPKRVRIVGEISNLSKRNHWYFSLKDNKAVIGCVAWASKARAFRFDAEDGMEVVATGSVQFYSPQGRCQLYVDKLEPVGAGALELRFRALCNELRLLGYFDPGRKKKAPFFPRRIAVITSEKGAALQDVLDTLRKRCPAISVYLVDVRVQGEAAAGQIATALHHISTVYKRKRIDAVILTRGGGSIEDLWAFNERIVADALLNYPIHTIAAIGHETDTTIAELVADVRCATPTQAAMEVSPDRAELLIQIDQSIRRLTARIDHHIRLDKSRLHALKVGLRHPGDYLQRINNQIEETIRRLQHVVQQNLLNQRSTLDHLALALERIRPHRLTAKRTGELNLHRYRLEQALTERMSKSEAHLHRTASKMNQAQQNLVLIKHHRLEHLRALLNSINPKRITSRGYSITYCAESGRIIQSVNDVKPDAILTTTISDGTIRSKAIDITHDERE